MLSLLTKGTEKQGHSPDHDVRMGKKTPRGTKRALANIRRGKVRHHNGKKGQLPYFTVDGTQFHPKQKPYLWLRSRGCIEVSDGVVSITQEGVNLHEALRSS